MPTLIECAGGVIQNEHDNVLVVAKRVQGKDGMVFAWSLPKGALKDGETLEKAARREIKEETGVTRLKLLKTLGSYKRNGFGDPTERKRITMFHFRTTQTRFTAEARKQHPVSAWVQPDQVALLLSHPKDRAFFEQILGEL